MTAKDEYTEIQSCMKEMGISFSAAEIATWAAAEGASDEDLRHIRSLLDAIAEKRRNERMSFLMKISRIPEACVKTFDNYDFARLFGSSKDSLLQFRSLGFIHTGQTIAFFGETGTGKTHLASAIGLECCKRGFSAYFITMKDLADKMAKAISDGRTAKFLNGFSSQKCLIIDKMDHCCLDIRQTMLFFQLVDKRYKKRSGNIVITSNRQPSEWGELFADKQTGECILDRLFDHLISVSFSGSSFRGSDRLLLSFKAKSPSVILK